MEEGGEKEILGGVTEDYQKYEKLMEQSKSDPPSTPYCSKYAAKVILEKLKIKLSEMNKESDTIEVDSVQADVELNMGIIDMDTEDFASAEKNFETCLATIKDHEGEPGKILTSLGVLNRLGLMWSDRGETAVARDYLLRAEQLYNTYKQENATNPPVVVSDLLSAQTREPEKAADMMEKLHTHTLFYLGQVYQLLEEPDKSAACFYSTLNRQLNSNDFDPVDWALNAATLAQYFLANDNFMNARHHLACATVVLNKHESELTALSDSNASDKIETLNRRKADLNRCWGKYCIVLLCSSRDDLLSKEDDELINTVNKVSIADTVKPFSSEVNATFSLDISDLEVQVTGSKVLDFEQARPVFLHGQKCLNQAKEYYTKDDNASDYVEIIQDQSKLFQYLAFFESNSERQCKMLKRRVDLLEEVLKDLNPQYYLNVCRQMRFELAEIYSDMRDIKVAMTEQGEREITASSVKKINQLTEKSIKYFSLFLDSFRDLNNALPETYPEELTRPVLLAQFCSARLYSKLMVTTQVQKLDNLNKSLEGYRFVLDYCKKHSNIKDIMKLEYEICEEMVKLLPLKMNQVIGVTPT